MSCPHPSRRRAYGFLDQLNPGNAVYVSDVPLRVRGPLVEEAFEAALNDVIARHESLRTRFVAIDGEPVQVIEPELRVRLDRRDLSGGSTSERLQELAAEVSGTHFDLAAGPLPAGDLSAAWRG